MNKFFNILISTVRSKIMPLWTKLRMWCSLTFIRTKILAKIRQFFVKILDVRPRNKGDYYPVFRWLISKRLAFFMVIVTGMVAVWFILSSLPENFLNGNKEKSIDTYKYRSVALKFHSGPVRILAKDGYVAYEGDVDSGAANGNGTLYDSDGNVVYTGEFANNMYNGEGMYYYPSGTVQYKGTFTDNIFNGKGSYYRENGILEYEGDYVLGERTGTGALCNSVGEIIYQGNIYKGDVNYPDFLARPTSDVSELYTGELAVYESNSEYCVAMPEIDAVYSVRDGSNSLESEWTVDRIYVMKNKTFIDGKAYTDINEVRKVMGEPLYFGTSWVNLPEAAAWNILSEKEPARVSSVTIKAEEGIENIFDVSGYDRNFEIYIYTFEKDGLLYTFYFEAAGKNEFLMYSIEKA